MRNFRSVVAQAWFGTVSGSESLSDGRPTPTAARWQFSCILAYYWRGVKAQRRYRIH